MSAEVSPSDDHISGSERTLTSPCESLDCASNAVT